MRRGVRRLSQSFPFDTSTKSLQGSPATSEVSLEFPRTPSEGRPMLSSESPIRTAHSRIATVLSTGRVDPKSRKLLANAANELASTRVNDASAHSAHGAIMEVLSEGRVDPRSRELLAEAARHLASDLQDRRPLYKMLRRSVAFIIDVCRSLF
jgi:hypothetical protein